MFKNYFEIKKKRRFLFFFLILKRLISYRSFFFFKTRYDIYVLKTTRISNTSKQSLFKVKRLEDKKIFIEENLNRVVSISRANILRNYFIIILHYHILIIIFRLHDFVEKCVG